jgi:hypothetical protein
VIHFAVLSIAPADEDAIRCKVVALIKADNIAGALSVIKLSQSPTVDFSYFKVFNSDIFFSLAVFIYLIVIRYQCFSIILFTGIHASAF